MVHEARSTNRPAHDFAAPIPILNRRDDAVRVWVWRSLRLRDESSFALSERCGLGRASCHRWLTGATEPTFARAMTLLDAMGVELDASLPTLISGADATLAMRSVQGAGGDA